MSNVKFHILIIMMLFPPIILNSCSKEKTKNDSNYIAQVEKFREEKDNFMKSDPSSPFNQDSMAHFHPLNYYKINPEFVFKSKLYEYPQKDTVTIFGTKGEARKAVRFGYVNIDYKDKVYRVNVYKSWAKNGQDYYSIWFTDETTGKETYEVGRYIDFYLDRSPDSLYTIDFNLAYNPYCAYSSIYSCAIPTKEDHIPFAVEAGEKKFHD
jgi:uncharacterized protein (DUF1684 family)